MALKQRRIHAAQVEALAAGQDRDRDFADFGRGEDELRMRRRLFQRLQEAVERRLRQHVHLVHDEDAVARGGGLVADRLDNLADVVDAGVRGRVHFKHVDMAAFHDRLAVNAKLLDIERGPVRHAGPLVIERARQDAGGGRLADAAHAGQHVGLRDPVHLERIAERPDHDVLADEVFEAPRAVFAGKHNVRRSRLRILRRGLVYRWICSWATKAKRFLGINCRPQGAWLNRHREAASAAVAIQRSWLRVCGPGLLRFARNDAGNISLWRGGERLDSNPHPIR